MSTKALKSQLLAAVAMVLVSSIALGSSTYAWFAINNRVTATGMSVTTQVSNNLFIADDELSSTAKKADNLFTSSLVQTKSAILEPVSTVDGKAFFYTNTNNVKANGDAVVDTYLSYSTGIATDSDDSDSYDNDFEANYQTADAVGYVDYVFQLKAVNTKTDQAIVLKNLKLTYGGSDSNGYNAFRAAMFWENITSATPTDGVGSNSLLFKTADGVHQTPTQAVNGTTTLGNVVYCADAASAKIPVEDNKTEYFKVVIRLWLEGEDTKCTNATFANLTDAWSLDIDMEFVDESTNAVENLEVASTDAATNLRTSDSADSAVAFSAGGKTFYAVTSKTLGSTGKQLYADSATLTVDNKLQLNSKIYVLEDNRYPIDVTNQVTITAAS